MPRGVKKTVDYAKEIEEIEQKISTHKNLIDTLKKEKSNLKREQQKAEKVKLVELIADSGLTAEQLSDLISKVKK